MFSAISGITYYSFISVLFFISLFFSINDKAAQLHVKLPFAIKK